jgi:hypothetical protein
MAKLLTQVMSLDTGLEGTLEDGSVVRLSVPKPSVEHFLRREDPGIAIGRAIYNAERMGFDFIYFGKDTSPNDYPTPREGDMLFPYVLFKERV